MSDRYSTHHGLKNHPIFDLFQKKSLSQDAAIQRLNKLEDVRLAAKYHVDDSSAKNLLALVNALEACEPKTVEQLLQERLEAADDALLYSSGHETGSVKKYFDAKAAHEKALESKL